MKEIRRSVVYRAPIRRVWAFLTEREKIASWLMPNSFAPVPGHRFTMDCPPGIGSGAPVRCQVTEVVPPHQGAARLAYTWVIDQPLTETLLEIDLQEQGATTRLDLVHSGWDGLGPADLYVRDRHEQGWDHLLGTALPALLETDAADG